MSNHSNSICQLIQLHIDAYLDSDLEPARVTEFRSHVDQCEHCAAEVHYAEQLHAAVIDLPILNCSDAALEPIDRLFLQSAQDTVANNEPAGNWFEKLYSSIPKVFQYGIPASLVLLVGLGLGSTYLGRDLGSDTGAELAGVDPGLTQESPQYTPAEVMQAIQDLEIALDYLGQMSQRTNVMIEDRFLLRQLQDTVRATFREEDIETNDAVDANGPI